MTASPGPLRRRQLGSVWDLPALPGVHRGLPDVERLCQVILVSCLRKEHRPVTETQFQDDLAWLLGEVSAVEAKYEAARGVPFENFMRWKLGCELLDEWRSQFGRDGGKRGLLDTVPLGTTVGADDEWIIDAQDPNEGDRRADRLEQALSGGAVDGPESRVTDLGWVLSGAGGGALQEVAGLGRRANETTTARDRGADRELEEVAA